jgi:hypothetical protein
MLGRLEMDVDECITAFSRLMKAVFEEKPIQLLAGRTSRAGVYFDSKKLKSVVEEVINHTGTSPTDAFNNGKVSGCRT